MPRVSVIVPTLNEEELLLATLSRVTPQEKLAEIIVVDGGSTDGTRETASSMQVQVIEAESANRAAQMNLGAARAKGDFLLFLHADTLVPAGALAAIVKALSDPVFVGGAFARRYDSSSLFLAVTCHLAEIRNVLIGWHLGDQGIFCRREAFEILGGYRLISPFEDLDFSRRLGRMGRLATLRPAVVSSGRRFRKQGAVRQTLRDLTLTLGFIREQRRKSSTPLFRAGR